MDFLWTASIFFKLSHSIISQISSQFSKIRFLPISRGISLYSFVDADILKERKIPLRTCVISKEKFPKRELLRVVRTPEGEVKIDITGKMNGHGAYIKKDKDIILQAKKSKALEKYLEISINDSLYDEMLNTLEVK